jgi:hypothetical protein
VRRVSNQSETGVAGMKWMLYLTQSLQVSAQIRTVRFVVAIYPAVVYKVSFFNFAKWKV